MNGGHFGATKINGLKRQMIRLVSSLPDECFHRADLEGCPYRCPKPNPTEAEEPWNPRFRMTCDGWVKTLRLVATGDYRVKKGHWLVASECPNCFQLSWIHEDIGRIADSPHIYGNKISAAAKKYQKDNP